VLPDVLVNPEDPHPGQMARISVDEAAGRGDGNTVDQLQPTPRALAVAVTLIRSTARRWRIQRVTRWVIFAPSSAHGSEAWKIFRL